ncbi:M15 family metallopeptidase [Candidatus Dependentiae bacterium]|nr:M15 family metallopeptidase [Candidatus Dependentiae bacterium]
MYLSKQKSLRASIIISIFINHHFCLALTQEARSKGFVYLHEIDPSIYVSLRYASSNNFMGRSIEGYKKPIVILTLSAAQALKRVQAEVKKNGYSVVVYDAYRPQQAVDSFVRWSKDTQDDTKKSEYYPRVKKADILKLGYVAQRSGHSRGSTVDVTLIKTGQHLHAIKPTKLKLLDGYTITFLDDGTVDMGSSFDLFDEASHGESTLVEEKYRKSRRYLKTSMEKQGFKGYAKEWWHFTLNNEPFSAGNNTSYFNFSVK